MTNNALIPFVIERVGQSERSYDLYSRLLKERIIFIAEEIDDHLANAVIAQLLFLNFENKTQDISVYINSPGGSVTAGLAIYDTIQFVTPKVSTFVMGQACSMGAVLLAAGATGKRYSLPNSRIMIHQPWGGASGTSSDIEIQAKEINKLKTTLYNILSKHTGKDFDTIYADCERDYFMSAEEAKAYGLVDEILEKQVS